MKIAQSSPLFEYWNSQQDENDEKKRLSKINSNEPASELFRNEPYKWEILYQSIVRNIINGDEKSIKGLMVLLATINNNEKEITLNVLEDLLSDCVINKLRNEKYQDIKSSKNNFTAIFILLNIFFNPFGLVIKNNKNQIYERTGMFFYHLRNLFIFKKL